MGKTLEFIIGLAWLSNLRYPPLLVVISTKGISCYEMFFVVFLHSNFEYRMTLEWKVERRGPKHGQKGKVVT